MNSKSLPYSKEAEQSVLGAMLLDKDTISKVSEIISAEDFYRPEHQVIYKLIQDISNQGMSVDLITLSDKRK